MRDRDVSEAALPRASPHFSPTRSYLGYPPAALSLHPQSCSPLQDMFPTKLWCLHRRMP